MDVRRITLILLLLIGAFPVMAQGYYIPVTVNTGQVAGTQTDFAVLIDITNNALKTTGSGGHAYNGNDIRPYSNSSLATALTFEQEFYDGTSGHWIGWVKVPSLADGYVIYLGYGDTGLGTDGSSTGTWGSQYKFRGHLAESSGTTLADSTSNAANLTKASSGHPAPLSSAKIDGGQTFVATSNDYASTANTALNITGSKFFGGWVYIEDWSAQGNYPRILFKNIDGSETFQLTVDVNNHRIGSQINNGALESNYSISLTAWHRVLSVYNSVGPTLVTYIDGAAATDLGVVGYGVDSPGSFYIGDRNADSSTAFNGALDEVVVGSGTITADFASSEYNNQSAPGTFYAVGSEVAVSSGGGGPLIGGELIRGALSHGGRLVA